MSEICCEDYSDDEDSSSSSHNLNSALDRFRHEWKQELVQDEYRPSQNDNGNETKEETAKRLFLKGVDAEQAGSTSEAIYYYRRAIQLCPDVESTIDYSPREPRTRLESESSFGSCSAETSSSGHGASDHNNTVDLVPEEEEDLSDLLGRFRRLNVCQESFCSTAVQQTAQHISDLPTEILVCVFNWVVSSHLDTRSLENLALVSRGFYVLARDESIWGKVCKRIWKADAGRPMQYGTWRDMYLTRPRVCFDGCYISKMTYVRQGEQSLDGFYQPIHIVEYFRYLRFFANGTALMLTTPEEPASMVYKLKARNNVHGLLQGRYKFVKDKVTLLMKRCPVIYNKNFRRPRQRPNQNQNQNDNCEQTYELELEIKNCGKRRNFALIWKYYALNTTYLNNGTQTKTVFDLTYKTYPPMYFSPVRSYTTATDGPL